MARLLAREVHAVVEAIDYINVRMACRAEENGVSRRWAAVRMRSRVGDFVMRPEVGFHFNDPAGKDAVARAMNQKFAEKPRGDMLGGGLEERSAEQATWNLHTFFDFYQFG